MNVFASWVNQSSFDFIHKSEIKKLNRFVCVEFTSDSHNVVMCMSLYTELRGRTCCRFFILRPIYVSGVLPPREDKLFHYI